MKKILLILFLFLSNISPSQDLYNQTWCFGDSALLKFDGISFSSPSKASMKTLEGCSTISDSSGNLIMYSDGVRIWNRNHTEMPNADSIDGGPPIFDWGTSTTQAALILPKPNSSNLFYVFYLKSQLITPSLQYCVVDISLDSGLGDVISKNNVLTADTLSEKMIAIKHANGRDWWLITHLSKSNVFTKFLITPFSIQGPFYQSIGTVWNQYDFFGQINSSQNGKMLAMVSPNFVDVFDFDRCSGDISNFRNIENYLQPTTNFRYGCALSPNNRFLYVNSLDSLYQYDLNNVQPHANRFSLFFNQYYQNYYLGLYQISLGQLQNWNGKIFMACGYIGATHSNLPFNSALSVIDNPDSLFASCNFNAFGIPLPNGHSMAGLPNTPNFNLGALADTPCDTITGINYQIQKNNSQFIIFPNPTSDNFYLQTNQKGTLIIYNQLGQIIFKTQIEKEKTNINTSDFAKGIYFVQLITTTNIFTKKIIVINK